MYNFDKRLRGGKQVSQLLIIFITGLVLFLAGCQPARLSPPLRLFEVPIEGLNTETVSQMITAHAEQFRNLRGTGKVTIQTWEERYRFSEVFVLEKPVRFRLATLGFLDQPVVFLVSDDAMLSLYSKKQNTYYRGVASQANLFKLSGVNLSVEDAIAVFSGNPPKLTQINSEWGMPLAAQQQYYLERTSVDDNRIQRIWFDATRNVIAHLEEYMLTNGKQTLSINFDDYRAEQGAYPVPAKILIDRPIDKTRVKIDYRNFTVNQELEPDIFAFTPPVNAIVYQIDDVNAPPVEQLAPYKEFQVKGQIPEEEK
jgi:outer membrane lipoprotein-sorting protein